jgi:SAM-dependent methyltransferase
MAEISFDGEIPMNYDRYLGPILFAPYADDLVGRILGGPGDVLELACGTGILTRRLLDQLPPTARLVATDLSPAMLDYAEGQVGQSDRIRWQQADATALPFPDATFDVVACQFGVMFFPDKLAAMREVRRVLRPGGSFLFNVWSSLEDAELSRVVDQALRERFPDDPPGFLNVPHSYHQPEVILATLEEAGFGDVRIERVEKAINGASARDFATGTVTGSPIKVATQGRAAPGELIDMLAARIARVSGDPIRGVRLLALVVTAIPGQ